MKPIKPLKYFFLQFLTFILITDSSSSVTPVTRRASLWARSRLHLSACVTATLAPPRTVPSGDSISFQMKGGLPRSPGESREEQSVLRAGFSHCRKGALLSVPCLQISSLPQSTDSNSTAQSLLTLTPTKSRNFKKV